VDLPLPSQQEIRTLLSAIAIASGQNLESGTLGVLSQGCSGLTEQRARQIAARAIARRGRLDRDDLD